MLTYKGTFFAILLAVAQCATAQSLWKEDGAKSMVADRRAMAVGDILTILVQENNSASKDNSTKTAKKSSLDASIQSFLYGPGGSGLLTHNGKYPAMKLSSANDFSGGGQINNSERITARIAVKVIDVLPNGNLIIEGTRKTAFAGETQDAVLRGVVRQADIAANNTTYSYNIADATIRYVSNGSISDTQRKGWFTKVWDKVSPF
ncbi:MAG: flagellar basal body L-ring protein FlgH [Verrucomicrobiota bacterium]|nr:flagellar basal body L-ring protein FlgH [Verrucomicrobiota bacterium]